MNLPVALHHTDTLSFPKMFELTVETRFAAAHAISIAGTPEPLHGHNWHVTAQVRGEKLDSDGLVCDFHTVQEMLGEIVSPFHNNNLNTTPPFDRTNPTAELLASYIATRLSASLDEALAPHAKVHSVRVTEADGCAATYYMPP